MYMNDKACIKIDNKVTDVFGVNQGVKQGCILSPLLFNLYMSDLPAILDKAIDGLDTTREHPSCLIWADDIILISETEDGLNRMLRAMECYCFNNELVLNTEKTKCMIFNKTGKLIRKKFMYNNMTLENVRTYKYLGFIMTPSGEIRTGLKDLRDRAMKAFFSLKTSMGMAFDTDIKTTLHLLDTLIKPILLYVSDFWGCLQPARDNPIEKFHIMACKHILGVQKQTTNIGVLLELGRIPIQTHAIKAAIKNWERIKSYEVNKYLKMALNDVNHKNPLWNRSIKDIFDKNGFSAFYNLKTKNIHKEITKRLADVFHQEAFNTISSPDSKLRTYGLLKREPGLEKYLYEINNPQIRRCCTKFRLSNHSLNIEVGRYKALDEKQRICPFCPSEVEREIHFILDCCAFKSHRREMNQFIIKTKPSFPYMSKTKQFQYLFSDEMIKFASKFIHDWMQIRSFLVSNPKNLV